MFEYWLTKNNSRTIIFPEITELPSIVWESYDFIESENIKSDSLPDKCILLFITIKTSANQHP